MPSKIRLPRFVSILLLTLAFGAGSSTAGTAPQPVPRTDDNDGVLALLRRLEQIVQAGDQAAFLGTLTESANQARARDFGVTELLPGCSRAVIQERDREPLKGAPTGTAYRLVVDAFCEFGSRGRVATWRLDVRRIGDRNGQPQEAQRAQWALEDEARVSSVETLYKLSINTTQQFSARNLRLSAEDLDLTMPEGSIFVSDVDIGVTALVLLGKGTVSFHPEPRTEKGQVKIFCGSATLETTFDVAYVRFNPGDFDRLTVGSELRSRPVDARELRRAQDVFREEAAKSFGLDLADLSRDNWSLLPAPGDFLAEIRTKRYETLTYARSSAEAEDITFFDRKHHRNIALYASKEKLASRGRFYNEDDLEDYDILDYDIDVTSLPDRQWIEGKTRIYMKVRAYVLSSVTLKLADSLVVRSIVSNEFGRLFGIRVKNQNTLVVNLPTSLTRDSDLTLIITYAGRLEPQAPEREAVEVQQGRTQTEELPFIPPEPSFLYSSRTFWYPQGSVSDYATARMRISVPATLDCVASGMLEPGFPALVQAKDPAQNRKLYVFTASQPLRYLAFIVSRFVRAETVTIGFDQIAEGQDEDPPLKGVSYDTLSLSVESNPRQAAHSRDLVERAADIAGYYRSLIGDTPYPSFTVALVENELPGGHSPAYFAELNQPLASSPFVWRNDPASFVGYGDFFIAHELAHQWWGQAVGWQNYHEQWLSEGFAQYFAALYAQHHRGDELFASVLRHMRRWAMAESDQGPVYLGYRLGHIKSESRVFRALVYDKGAIVLHMLRRLVGDDAFFGGLRKFYRANRFRKAGTEDLREAMEESSGLSLERFFERWIDGSTLPKLKFSYQVDHSNVVLRVEQMTDDLFDVPVTAVIQCADRKPLEVVIPVTDRVVERRVPLPSTLRSVEISKDDGTLADIVK